MGMAFKSNGDLPETWLSKTTPVFFEKYVYM